MIQSQQASATLGLTTPTHIHTRALPAYKLHKTCQIITQAARTCEWGVLPIPAQAGTPATALQPRDMSHAREGEAGVLLSPTNRWGRHTPRTKVAQ